MNDHFHQHLIKQQQELPPLLREIDDPPSTWSYCSQEPPNYGGLWLTVVGSRNMSAHAKKALSNIMMGIQGTDVTIVSGLAFGVDYWAHHYALEYGLRCAAVPGSGLSSEVIYPRSHESLASRIVKQGGYLFSEFENTQKAQPWTFPQRNRIMAGLSQATIIIEARKQSGTLITARLALEYNRDVFVVPGSIIGDHAEGSNALLQEGAIPLLSSKELLDHYKLTSKSNENTSDLNLNEVEAYVYDHRHQPQSVIFNGPYASEEITQAITCLELRNLL